MTEAKRKTTTASTHASNAQPSPIFFVLLLLDVVLLALIELFFLPLRLDGSLLPDAGGFPVPVTILVALATTPWLVSQTAKMFGARKALFPLLLWVLTLLVVAIAGPGGDQILVMDWRAFLLLAAGAFPGAMVLGSALGVAARNR